MIYEIINPSDPVTIEHEDIDVARATCLLLGRGAYGLEDDAGNDVLPVLLFGADEWMEANGFDIAEILSSKREAVAECLRSAICCSARDRSAIFAATKGDASAMAAYNDARRSSVNDICGYAFALSDSVLRQSDGLSDPARQEER